MRFKTRTAGGAGPRRPGSALRSRCRRRRSSRQPRISSRSGDLDLQSCCRTSWPSAPGAQGSILCSGWILEKKLKSFFLPYVEQNIDPCLSFCPESRYAAWPEVILLVNLWFPLRLLVLRGWPGPLLVLLVVAPLLTEQIMAKALSCLHRFSVHSCHKENYYRGWWRIHLIAVLTSCFFKLKIIYK